MHVGRMDRQLLWPAPGLMAVHKFDDDGNADGQAVLISIDLGVFQSGLPSLHMR